MKRLSIFAAAATAAVTMVAAPAFASVTWTFSTFNQNLNTGYPLTYNSGTQVLSGSGNAIVTFNSITPLPNLVNLPVNFTFTAQATGPLGSIGGVLAQSLTGGTLTFSTGSVANLLTIDWSGGALWGFGNTWSIESTNGIAGITYSSDVASFNGYDPALNAFNIAFNFQNAIPFSVQAGQNLPSFAARFTGQAVVGVPEPATWGLMIVGFAGLGAALRHTRRERTLAAAA